jgi:hypothetical protein
MTLDICCSHYFPNNIHFLVGKQSQFVYFTNYVTLRRKGRMTPHQKKRRRELERYYRVPPTALYRSVLQALGQLPLLIPRCTSHPLKLFSDAKQEYRWALRNSPILRTLVQHHRISHTRIHSRVQRDLRNPLFAVNYIDREVRKDLANHVRKTTCFARNVNCCMERLVVYLGYHNYAKPYRVRWPGRGSHAEHAGLEPMRIRAEMRQLFTRRSFLSRCEKLSGFDRELWLRRLPTPLKRTAEYVPHYAAA